MLLLSIDWTNLHELLRSLYDEMMPLCEDMASVAKGVAGLGIDFQLRVDLPAHFLNGLQQLLQSLCRKVLRLHRNQSGIRSRCILRFEEQVSTRRFTI